MTKARRHRPRRGQRLRAVRPTHSEDGVDLTLIRWMLSLTPEERIKVLEDTVYALTWLRNGAMQETGREKDRAVLPILRKTLEEKSE